MTRIARPLPAAVGLLALLAVACSQRGVTSAGATPAYPAETGAITVSAGENFYGDLLHQLGGSHLRVYAFLSDPNADPHEYESSSAAARAVADSRLVIVNGLGYDAFMDRLLRTSPRADREVIDVHALVAAPEGSNPHLWYDPRVMPRVAEATASALREIDAAHAAEYVSNLQAFLVSLRRIDDRVAGLRERFQGAPVAFTEPVYGYMAEALGLDVRSPEAFTRAIEEGSDPSAQATAQMQDLLRRHEVTLLVYNSQTTTRVTAAIRELARASGVHVVGVTETEPPGKTFQEWQLEELAALEAALAAG